MSLGLRYMVMSAFGFSIMAVCVKLSSEQGIPVLEIVAARALVSLVLSMVDVRRKKEVASRAGAGTSAEDPPVERAPRALARVGGGFV